MSLGRDLGALAAFMVLIFGVAWIGSTVTMPAIPGWYAALSKPAFTPPNWMFGPVWGVLYFMIAVAGWLIWRAQRRQIAGARAVQPATRAQSRVVSSVLRTEADRAGAGRDRRPAGRDRSDHRRGLSRLQGRSSVAASVSRMGRLCHGAQCGHLAVELVRSAEREKPAPSEGMMAPALSPRRQTAIAAAWRRKWRVPRLPRTAQNGQSFQQVPSQRGAIL
jgi:TspO/MBR family